MATFSRTHPRSAPVGKQRSDQALPRRLKKHVPAGTHQSESPARDHPSWNHLYEIAETQQGLFTTQQAADAGYSPQLLVHHVHSRRVLRVRRGIYRLVHFPGGAHENLIEAWLWSERTGVISHQSALELHELWEVPPTPIHLTLPSEWRRRRFRIPEGVVLHHADLSLDERTSAGTLPVTTPLRALNECAHDGLSAELLLRAAKLALIHDVVARSELGAVIEAIAPFGHLL